MPRRKPASLKDDKKTSIKSSFNAMVYIPRFFREIWKVNKKLFLLSAFCRLIGALLPVIILWIGKLIIDEIILQISLNLPDYTLLWTYVGAEFALIILSDLI